MRYGLSLLPLTCLSGRRQTLPVSVRTLAGRRCLRRGTRLVKPSIGRPVLDLSRRPECVDLAELVLKTRTSLRGGGAGAWDRSAMSR